MEAADHELALEPSCERLVRAAELLKRPFDHIDCVHPAEQSRVRFGHLERDPGTLPRIGREAQRLLQLVARRLAPGACLRLSGLAEHFDSLRERGGSPSARRNRSAAAPGAPPCIAARAASRKRLRTQPSPAGCTPTR